MNAPKKPHARKPAGAASAMQAQPVPEITLTADEMRMAMAYRKMDDRRRGEALEINEGQADKYPRNKAPFLRLIVGGAA